MELKHLFIVFLLGCCLHFQERLLVLRRGVLPKFPELDHGRPLSLDIREVRRNGFAFRSAEQRVGVAVLLGCIREEPRPGGRELIPLLVGRDFPLVLLAGCGLVEVIQRQLPGDLCLLYLRLAGRPVLFRDLLPRPVEGAHIHAAALLLRAELPEGDLRFLRVALGLLRTSLRRSLGLRLALGAAPDSLGVLLEILARLELGHGGLVLLLLLISLIKKGLLLFLRHFQPLLPELLRDLETLELGVRLLLLFHVLLHEHLEGIHGRLGHTLQVRELCLDDGARAECLLLRPEELLALVALPEETHVLIELLQEILRLLLKGLLALGVKLLPHLTNLLQVTDLLLLLLGLGVELERARGLAGHLLRRARQRDEPHAVLQPLDDLALVRKQGLDGHAEALGLGEILLPELILAEALDLRLPILHHILHLGIPLFLQFLVEVLPLFLVLDHLLPLHLLRLGLVLGCLGRLALLVEVDSEGGLRRLLRRGVQELQGHDLHGLVHELSFDLGFCGLVRLELVSDFERIHILLPLFQQLLLLSLQPLLLVLRGLGELDLQRGDALALAFPGGHFLFVLSGKHGEHRFRLLRHVPEVHEPVLSDLQLLTFLQEADVLFGLLEILALGLDLGSELVGLRDVGCLLFLRNLLPELGDLLDELSPRPDMAFLLGLLHEPWRNLGPEERRS
mmetsp:Transcript_23472/g.59778  ORF Transcript_23472/g.59778 Transcript_23472/m.59778 type:complete len:679 (-) Transcript_23472:1050-3086(-)